MIPRIDAGRGDRDLPQIELLAEIVLVVHREPHDGVAGRLEGAEFGVDAGFRVGQIRADVDEEPIVAVVAGVTERLARDRHDAFAVLAGRLGDQLFGPRAEGFDVGVGDDRELVAPVHR